MALLVLAVAACDDAGTGPPAAPPPNSATTSSAGEGAVPQQRVPGGFEEIIGVEDVRDFCGVRSASRPDWCEDFTLDLIRRVRRATGGGTGEAAGSDPSIDQPSCNLATGIWVEGICHLRRLEELLVSVEDGIFEWCDDMSVSEFWWDYCDGLLQGFPGPW